MKKKNIICAVLALLISLYFVNTCFAFENVDEKIADEFSRYSRSFDDFALDIVNRDYDIDRVIKEVAVYSASEFPTAAILYDSEGNIVSKSGVYLEFIMDEEYVLCRLDDYLTQEIKEQILEFKEEHGVSVERFDYNIKDGEIVPVGMRMSQTGSWKDVKEEVVFIDSEAEYSVEGGINEYFSYSEDWLLDENHYNSKLYQSVCEKAFGDDVRNSISEKIVDWKDEPVEKIDSETWPDNFYDTRYYNIGGENYALHIRSEYNRITETVCSSDFIGQQINLTLIYLVIGAVVLIAVNKKCKKYGIS